LRKVSFKFAGEMNMRITAVEERDFSEVMTLIRAEFPYVSFDEAKIRKRIASGKIFLFKAVEARKLVGFIELELFESIARINGLTVKPAHRKKGVAKKLLDYSIAFLKKRGIERVLLLVKQGNKAAKKVYKEAGFKFIGMYHRQLDNEVVEEMELDFSPKDEEDLDYVG
jgi:ribosomal protein S18 acetylase RimI-like enzyme